MRNCCGRWRTRWHSGAFSRNLAEQLADNRWLLDFCEIIFRQRIFVYAAWTGVFEKIRKIFLLTQDTGQEERKISFFQGPDLTLRTGENPCTGALGDFREKLLKSVNILYIVFIKINNTSY
jgi:hypothetical protein